MGQQRKSVAILTTSGSAFREANRWSIIPPSSRERFGTVRKYEDFSRVEESFLKQNPEFNGLTLGIKI
jgi:hypothetical protein